MITALAVTLTALFVALGAAKVAAATPMRAAATHLGMTVQQYRVIGVLELAGATGMCVGLAMHPIGVLAAAGLMVLLSGAAVAHARRGDAVARSAIPVLVGAAVLAYAVLL